ncbi:hypothetical protein CAPTEDRAFT_126088 [Capitella teleta]|uniref:Sec1 family domain-containing protein 2 n=1 Tax=Capitella teleta TaxID=283909 RepID=R7U8Q1_CAPTE|nr:hypothetical protein CAPTEDRAFT_126088 [Capitella teleta]|eukprot:ELU00077.1 hypothetical protein CAPTEDRAFT_126088 [Capitella teleta]
MSVSVDLFNCSVSCWDSLSVKAHKAVVFIDTVSAECLHWHGGAQLLFNAGALAVKEFSAFENGLPDQKRAMFIVSGGLVDTTRVILQNIIEASSFEQILLVTSLNPAMHTVVEYGPGESDEGKAFNFYRQLISEWSEDRASVNFMYLPLVVAPVVPNLFFLPEHQDLFPLLPNELHSLFITNQNQARPPMSVTDVGYEHLPKMLQLKFKLLVCSLNSMLEVLKISEDVYCLGQTSRMVANELAGLSWARSRRKTCETRASLLIVDRTLDVASAVGHHGETVLDKILSTLGKLPEHNCDVAVEMASLCKVTCNPDFGVIVPGCLSHSDDGASTSLLATMATTKFKECLMEMNRQLVEAANREKLPIKLGRMNKITVDTLNSHVAHFQGKISAIRRNSGLLQLVLATIQAVKSPKSTIHDSLFGIEKGLLQVLGDDSGRSICVICYSSIFELMCNFRLYSVEDILVLLVYVYSLAGPDCYADKEEENFLKNSWVSVFFSQGNSIIRILIFFLGDDLNGSQLEHVLEDLFTKLNSLSSARDELKQYSSSFEAGSMTSQASLKPLLKQVITDVLDPSKPELIDIENRSSGLKDLLKSGFGLFRAARKPRPSDHPVLVIFVLGGITPTEVKQVRDISSKFNSHQV